MEICVKKKTGIVGMINQFNLAANDVYKPKFWKQNDIDLAILVLRIGGPALLYAFHQQNKLPSSSFIYKVSN